MTKTVAVLHCHIGNVVNQGQLYMYLYALEMPCDILCGDVNSVTYSDALICNKLFIICVIYLQTILNVVRDAHRLAVLWFKLFALAHKFFAKSSSASIFLAESCASIPLCGVSHCRPCSFKHL